MDIESYISEVVFNLKNSGIYLNDEMIQELRGMVNPADVDSTIQQIDQVIVDYVEKIESVLELREAYYEKVEENMELADLPVEYIGITLNGQDVDLLCITEARTVDELREALESSANIRLEDIDFSSGDLESIKSEVFRLYQDRLADRNEYIRNPSINLLKKVEYLKDSGILDEQEKDVIDEIVSSGKTSEEMVEQINEVFGPERAHEIYEIISENDPIEKSGIKDTDIESIENLETRIVEDFNSITIDDHAKYGSVALPDGTFDYTRLDKMLDYAKRHGKTARLNTIMFYMDCPEELYSLEKSEENRRLVKEKLTTYVDSITRHVRDKGYGETVRSIDVFNELLNRFPLEGEPPYEYRGDIPQVSVDDNIKAGWLKHLSVEDLCDVISVARRNLPDVDFMYNDTTLEDPRKMEATFKLLEQIRAYENSHGVRLIDSIGTQMHIDNDVSKEDIETMFRNLAQFGLPIEVTELDIAMTHGVEGLTDEEIEILRDKKVQEILGCISELKDECNIRGCTIWSKTDRQNFRVSLENERRIKNGEEPISTLHGGYFTEKMESKGKALIKKSPYRDFNYHTHTNRCGHAGSFSDQEYIRAAKSVGMTTLGFSDHIPFTDMEYGDPHSRMDISQVDDYISSIETLLEANPDMTILAGFEAEYDPAKTQFLCEMRDKVDYMILGQHFVRDGVYSADTNDSNYPIDYAKSVCEAMDTGIFDIVAHPDIFMSEYSKLTSGEDRRVFMENAKVASLMICKKAKEMGVAVELNLAGLHKNQGYPAPVFWQAAEEVGVKVVSGADAHNPVQLVEMPLDQQRAEERIGKLALNKVDIDYNPVEVRKKNQTLQQSLQRTKAKSITYESYISSQVVGKMLGEHPEMSIEEGCKAVSDQLVLMQSDQQDSVTAKRNDIMSTCATAVSEAPSFGCSSKDGVVQHVKMVVEAKTQINPQKKEQVTNALQKTDKSKSMTKPKQKVLTKSNNGGGNKGFASSLPLIIAITLVGTVIMLIVALASLITK